MTGVNAHHTQNAKCKAIVTADRNLRISLHKSGAETADTSGSWDVSECKLVMGRYHHHMILKSEIPSSFQWRDSA